MHERQSYCDSVISHSNKKSNQPNQASAFSQVRVSSVRAKRGFVVLEISSGRFNPLDKRVGPESEAQLVKKSGKRANKVTTA